MALQAMIFYQTQLILIEKKSVKKQKALPK